jgi:predicted lipoprotein with Yx(FWY)xxD motif
VLFKSTAFNRSATPPAPEGYALGQPDYTREEAVARGVNAGMGKKGRHLLALASVAAIAAASLGAAADAKAPTVTLKARTAGSLGKVLAAPSARTLYRLAPETSKSLLCTSAQCKAIWKPLLVSSKSTTVKLPDGISGTVGFVKRGTKYQVALSSHPLYTFASDTRSGQAKGEGIKSFGGTWHVLKVRTTKPAPSPSPQPTPGYPPYY